MPDSVADGVPAPAQAAPLRALVDAAPLAMAMVNEQGLFELVNAAYATLYGYASAELLGRHCTLVLPPSERAAATTSFAAAWTDPHTHQEEHLVETPAGATRVVRVTSTRATEADGRSYRAIYAEDLTELRHAEGAEAVAQERELVRVLMDIMPDTIYVKDTASRFTRINAAQAAFLGLDRPEDALGKTDADFFPSDLAQQLYREEQHIIATGEPWINALEQHTDAQGQPRWLMSTKVPITRKGGISGLVGISRDVTDIKRAKAIVAHQARHDALTGLPNRLLLQEHLRQALCGPIPAGRKRESAAFLLLDLNRFKDVNDSFGHHYGDVLLRQVAERIHAALRATDVVARLGGDEFAALLPQTDRNGALKVAQMIHAALTPSFVIEGQTFSIDASIGVVVSPDDGHDPETLLRRADVAMYVAKRRGEPYALYSPAADAHNHARFTLGAELRQAIMGDALLLHYQPKAALATGRITDVEALVRWPHPTRGLIPPDEFIPLAEQTGAIAPLTWWVLETALRQARAWRRSGRPLGVAVNLSAANLRDPRLSGKILTLLRRYATPPAMLRIELTESAIMGDPEHAIDVLTRLTECGVRLSVDDYGTGYSSLAYLKRLPIDEIKIDRSFVRDMAGDPADAAIVASTIGLGHSLGLRVVAEGVEDEETWRRLAELGCDLAQGYYLSRPLPAADLAGALDAAEARVTRQPLSA